MNEAPSFASLRAIDSRWNSTAYAAYASYLKRKHRLLKHGRTTAVRDGSRHKVYAAESNARWRYLKEGNTFRKYSSSVEAQRHTDRIVSSKTWAKIMATHNRIVRPIRIDPIRSRNWAGFAHTYANRIELSIHCGLSVDVLIHELAHMCGNNHHDVWFREDHIKLASRFISRQYANELKIAYRELKLKVNRSSKIQSPEKWIESYYRMKAARSKA